MPRALALPAALVGAVALAMLALPHASASSYPGSGDWTVSGAETVTGETINVTGNVSVNGDLELVNSTLILHGDTAPIVTYLALLNVSGRFTLTDSTLVFRVVLLTNATVPNGFRVGPGGTVIVRDFDDSMPGDGSRITATANGTYSTFAPGSHLTVVNSAWERLGWRGYPGLELNGTALWVDRAILSGTASLLEPGDSLPGLRTGVVLNGGGAFLENSSFQGLAEALVLRNGSLHFLGNLTFSGCASGALLENVTWSRLEGIVSGPAAPLPGFPAWPPMGTVIAIRGGANISVRGLVVDGDDLAAENQPLRGLVAELVADLLVADLSVTDAAGLLAVNGSGPVTLLDIAGARVGEGVRLTDSRDVLVSRASVDGDGATALEAVGCRNMTLEDISARSWVGLEIASSFDVTVANVTLNASSVGLRFRDGLRLLVSQVSVERSTTGIMIVNASDVALTSSRVVFSRGALDVFIASRVQVQDVDFSVVDGLYPDHFLAATSVSGLGVRDITYAGPCAKAVTISDSSVVSFDRLVLPLCSEGLSVSTTSYLDVPLADLRGVRNGTALGLYGVTDSRIAAADLSGAAGIGLAIIGSARLTVTSFNASGAGGSDGVIVALSGAIDLTDGLALGAYSWGVSVVNATGLVTMTRLRVSGAQGGVAILDSPGTRLVDCDVSMSGGDGVSVDRTSQGAVFRNLTLTQNAGAGLRMDAAGATLTDGNISGNGGDGIAPGSDVRLDWHVEVAASFTDGQTRFTGDLFVGPGASFVARRAAFHFDPGPRQVALSTPPLIDLGAGARALFDRVTLDSTNESIPYTLDMGPAASVEILGSSFVGSGRGLYASAVRGSPDFLAVRNSTFAAFTSPLDAIGASVEISHANYIDNDAGPRLSVRSLTFFNLTVENSTGAGLEVLGVPWVRGERLLARGNGGVGARFSSVADLALATSEVYENLRGGLLLDSCVASLTHTSVAGNSGFGLRLQGGGRASIEDVHVYRNSGAGLAAEDLDELRVLGALVYNGLGRGADLARVSVVTLDRAEFYDNAAFGLTAADVGNLTVAGARFAGNGVSQVVLQGWTVAVFVDGVLERSPGDAVVLNGTASGTFIAVAADGVLARVAASERAFAYLLNSTFAAPFVLDAARVDIAWNLSVALRRESGTAVDGATVTVRDVQGQLAATEATGSDGSTRTFTLMAKNVFAGGSVFAFSPHAFNASLAGGGGARLSVDVDRYMVVNLTADGTAPVTRLTLEGASGEGGWFLGPVTARLRASDESNYGITLFWRLAPGSWRNGTSAGNFTEDIVAVEGEGSTLLEYYAVDGVGNTEALQRTLIKVDLNAPTARFENLPANVTGGEFEVLWSATDTAGSACCTYSTERAYGDLPFEPWGNGTPARARFTPSAEGTYRFRLTAFDEAGRASRPVTGTLLVFLNGTLRIAVTDPSGAALAAATIVVEGTDVSLAGAGPFDIRLAPGTYRIAIRAPGFVPRTVDATVVSHTVTDVGALALMPMPEAVTDPADQGPLGLLLLLVAVAAAAAVLYLRRARKAGK